MENLTQSATKCHGRAQRGRRSGRGLWRLVTVCDSVCQLIHTLGVRLSCWISGGYREDSGFSTACDNTTTTTTSGSIRSSEKARRAVTVSYDALPHVQACRRRSKRTVAGLERFRNALGMLADSGDVQTDDGRQAVMEAMHACRQLECDLSDVNRHLARFEDTITTAELDWLTAEALARHGGSRNGSKQDQGARKQRG